MGEDKLIESVDKNALNEVQGKIEKWLDENNWPVPNWWQQAGTEPAASKKKNYQDYFIQCLRNRYLLVESDFRTILPSYLKMPEKLILYISSCEMIFKLLKATREVLEQDKVDLISTSEELDFLERFIIWIYPQHILKARITALKSNIELLQPGVKELYLQELDALMKEPILEDSHINDRNFDNIKLASIRSILDELIGACNRKELDDQISAGLQIRRLEALRLWGLIILGVFFISSPLMISQEMLSDWMNMLRLTHRYEIAWLSALAIILVGMIGGFLSSLNIARGSKTSLREYQEDVLKMQLRPIVGGFVSLLVFVLLSWNVIAGVTVKNPGSFLLIAFVSGFSERFFLRLIDLKNEQDLA